MPPPTTEELLSEAYARYQAGDSAAAAQRCEQVLERQPACAEAVYLLGAMAHEVGQYHQALPRLRRAVALGPGNAVFHNALGETLLALGERADALASFQHALTLRPTYERAHNNLGRLHHLDGNLKAARASFAEAIRLNPNYATAHNNLGASLQALGEFDAAAAHFQRALMLRPDYPEAHFGLGAHLQVRGDPDTAGVHFQQAIRARPTYARAYLHLGQVCEQLRRDYDALACYETAVRLQPTDAESHRRLGDLLVLKKDWPAALAALEHAVALAPDDPEPFARLVSARQQVCDWRTYPADLERLWRDAERQLAAGKATALVPFQALTFPWPRERLLAIARSHSDSMVRFQREQGLSPLNATIRRRTGRLRIGYLSGDFYDHPIGHLLRGFFGRHDRERFEVFVYSFGPRDDNSYRKQIAADSEHFMDVAFLSLPALARRIADDGVDILVDLMGYTGVNRFGVFAQRPAPIQVSFLGMLGTTGADFIDYLITDRIVTPPKFASAFTERFVTLPHSYLIDAPIDAADLAGPAAIGPAEKAALRHAQGLPQAGFVYCSFNSPYKIEPRTFAVWMNILAQVPGSVLWLYSPGPVVEDNLRREAAARGVAAERLVFAAFRPRVEHLHRHRAADLFLDTLTYNAAATATLALQTGLPVLTSPGETFASRVGASLLQSVGVPELIAADVSAYEKRAVELAVQPETLRQIRAKLAVQVSGAPLYDTPRFLRNLERGYLLMWENAVAGGTPHALEVLEPP